jgi:hypothetical protein
VSPGPPGAVAGVFWRPRPRAIAISNYSELVGNGILKSTIWQIDKFN